MKLKHKQKQHGERKIVPVCNEPVSASTPSLALTKMLRGKAKGNRRTGSILNQRTKSLRKLCSNTTRTTLKKIQSTRPHLKRFQTDRTVRASDDEEREDTQQILPKKTAESSGRSNSSSTSKLSLLEQSVLNDRAGTSNGVRGECNYQDLKVATHSPQTRQPSYRQVEQSKSNDRTGTSNVVRDDRNSQDFKTAESQAVPDSTQTRQPSYHKSLCNEANSTCLVVHPGKIIFTNPMFMTFVHLPSKSSFLVSSVQHHLIPHMQMLAPHVAH